MDHGNNRKVKEPRKLLLLDGLGALISSTMLGGVLVYFQQHIGMPYHILYSLALAAICFATFSLSSYLRKSSNPKRSLRIIAIVNILYCLISLGLVIHFYSLLTIFGIGYFLLEKVVVLSLAFIELKVSKI